MRLIDADALIDFLDVGHLRHSSELCYSEIEVANLLLQAPTVEAKPVVHCKDCVHWGTGVAGETEHVKCCEYGKYMVGENGYCCYAERGGKNE